MIKRLLIVCLIAIQGSCYLYADEGMWLLNLLNKNYDDLKKAGFKLTPEEIYSINNSSLKDAIVQFGNGCTGSLISAEGLIITNHHCGYGQIQANSTTEHNYLEEGFWAMRKKEELQNEGLTVKFLVRVEDVTSEVLKDLSPSTPEAERQAKTYEAANRIAKEKTKDTKYYGVVKSLFEGNSYYLFVYEIYYDVRLVGAPPSSIGKFGGDTDNWMWPRHTGDFSIFRVYTAPDGTPAEFDMNNVPLKSKKFLPVNISGVKKDDFAMVMGYPGSTNRYASAASIQQAIDVINPSVVKIREAKLAIMKSYMEQSTALKIKYASKYARTSNYWKYFIGQTKGLQRLDVVGKKKKTEEDFAKWADASSDRKSLYGTVVNEFSQTVKNMENYNKFNIYYREAIMRGADALYFAGAFIELKNMLEKKESMQEKPDNTFLSKLVDVVSNLKKETETFYRDFNLDTEKELFTALTKMFYNDVPKEFHPAIFAEIDKKYKGDFGKYADFLYKKSMFASKEKIQEYLTEPNVKKLVKDPMFTLLMSFVDNDAKHRKAFATMAETMDKNNRLFMDGLMKMNADKVYYPNANSTMRLSYGKVTDYVPRDAVSYSYFTTLKGVIEKEDEADDDFDVPAKLKELYQKKDYGRYAKDGEVWTCFTTTNDITGGNSGSPVMNGSGELIGLAFDGNWEAMSGDIAYEPELQRTIVCDIRYVLFIIEKFAGAQNLIKELQIKN